MKTYTNKYQPSSAEGSASAEYIIQATPVGTIANYKLSWPDKDYGRYAISMSQ